MVSKDEGRKKESEANRQSQQFQSNELPLNDYYINKEDNLNPKYTFDSFVVGPFNDLAFAASQAVIKKPGTAYNPLFVYGNTGHGKTHLIQGIGNALKNGNPARKIFYVTSETFAVDYITSVQNNKPNQFKEKYRKYDVLIMDDIQFLSKKTQTQEELFHLFNALYENNKQIVFSSDKHPNYIPDLEERLKSRFSAGMIVEVEPFVGPHGNVSPGLFKGSDGYVWPAALLEFGLHDGCKRCGAGPDEGCECPRKLSPEYDPKEYDGW